MAKYLAAASVLGAPCAAFTPSSNLRAATSPAAQTAADAQVEQFVEAPAASVRVQAAMGMIGLGAAGVAVAARMSKKQARGSRLPCRVAGITYPIMEKWDPLNLGSTDAKMERYTAVEIKHGRIAMIATLGYIFPEMFRFPGCEKFAHGLAAFSSIPVEGWVQLFLLIGAHEVLVKPRQGGMGMYDFGLGTEILEGIPDEELERRQTVERNNGRLAMIAIMGMMVQNGMFGKTPLMSIQADGWMSGQVGFLTEHVPACGPAGHWCALPASRGKVSRTAMKAFSKWDVRPDVTFSAATLEKFEASDMFVVVNEKIPTREEMPKSPAVPFLRYPEELRGWVGGEKGFDPLRVSDAVPVYLMREAELKHGRVCMLATLGWIATDLGVRFPGEMYQNVSTIQAHDAMVSAGQMGPFLGAIGAFELYCGYLLREGYYNAMWGTGWQRDAGDFFVGKNFMPKDPEAARIMKLKELENGRLAMIAFGGIVTAAVYTGKPWPFL